MKTPWKTLQPIHPDRDYVAVVTELVPRSRRSTGRLFRGARRSSIQIARATGIVGFATLAEPLRRRYRTISLWESETDVDAFARSGDHHELVRTLAQELEAVRSRRWQVTGRDGRPDWNAADHQLEQRKT
ncbi:hypothetical protein BH20ACT2_BH20ACT2_05340 [soil metagenome]